MNVMCIKNGNRILCAATIGMVGIQFMLGFMGVYDTLLHLLASQFSIILICLLGIWLSDVDFKETFRVCSINGKTLTFAFLAVICSFPAEIQMETEVLYTPNMLLTTAWIPVVTLACIMIPLIFLLVTATFRVNHRSFREAFRKQDSIDVSYNLPEVKEEEKIIDIWFILSIVVMVILTILNTWM